MAFIFPTNPQIGDSFYIAGSRYYYTGTYWAKVIKNSLGSRTYKSFTSILNQTEYQCQFSVENADIFINGIKLDSTDYDFNDNGLVTLNIAPDVGSNVEVIGYGVYDILHNVYYRQSEIPSNAIDGALWYNTSTTEIKTYNQSSDEWIEIRAFTPPTDEGSDTFLSGDGTYKEIDLTNYYTKAESDNEISTAIDTSVTAAVANILDSAPSTLDTLNELAAALNDNPNFATTVTTTLSEKLNSSEYTASDILTKIKTVDGSGSGLDADTIDGYNASITNTPSTAVIRDASGYINATGLNLSNGSGSSTMVWNSVDGTFDLPLLNGVNLQLGQELHIYAKATEAISNGDVVQFVGAQGDHILVQKATSTVLNINSKYLVGVATQSIAVNGFGYITWFGKVNGLNTLNWTAGTVLYFDHQNAGKLTTTIPTAPNSKIMIATVLRSHGTQGVLLIRPSFGNKVEDLHNVYTNNIANNDALLWHSLNNRWENKVLTQDLVGLDQLDNTADLDKPISTATQDALDLKADKSNSYIRTEIDEKVKQAKDDALAFAIALG